MPLACTVGIFAPSPSRRCRTPCLLLSRSGSLPGCHASGTPDSRYRPRREGSVDGAAGLEKIYREEAVRIRAMLAARLGDVGLAEELVQDAFVEALEHWPSEGLPPNPGGWLATTARRKAIDRLRRDRAGQAKLALLAGTGSPEMSGHARAPPAPSG